MLEVKGERGSGFVQVEGERGSGFVQTECPGVLLILDRYDVAAVKGVQDNML